MKDTIYEVIEGYMDEGKTGSIATIISRDGSSPRDVGAKMFIGEDGKIHDTIGGGGLEYKVQKHAMATMGHEKAQMIKIKMDGEEVASDGMICGGNVEVFLEPALEKHRQLYQRLEHLEKNGKKGVLITSLRGEFMKTLIERDMRITGDPLNASNDLALFQNHISNITPQITNKTLVETIHPSPPLYIFGAGHVSQFIAPLATNVGFQVTVIDDRHQFANSERFPDAHQVIVEDFQEVFNNLSFTGEEYVVIVTRGHQHDRDVLEESLKRETKYLGMIGSRRKVKMILEHMKECGYPPEKVDKVYSPIGLSIKAETPQEIAVSIVGELITVRRS
ncbi:XdhC/CoxI family protein [uncultured Methanobacterium sp.]|uniref:XdhC family protein n=1 Tax=uncultured Methanobacterium sp. TaxID=176306 RepID=UPI002AA82759|nr:XdhC/CoxI family protein [uncultured Methanobacterium sp.]